MNNEPVAYRHWMIDEEFPEDSCWEYFDAPTGEDCLDCIPLYTRPFLEGYKCSAPPCKCDISNYKVCCYSSYTHPVKELTDEEIKQIFQEQTGFYFDDNPADDLALMDFARAILRKAQEK